MNFLRQDIAKLWAGQDPMDSAFALRGEVFRDVPGRRTLRVELDSRHYFVKLHYGVGWREVVKNWLQFKHPIVGALNEYVTCRDLDRLGIAAPKPAAYATSTGSIASRRSFVLCDELFGYTSLEDVTDDWIATSPHAITKHRLLYAVARFAKTFHDLGFIHRDFYICHILVQNDALSAGRFELAVLDLHRARRFSVIPLKWLKRDLAALLYSTLDLGYSPRDWLRFIRIYRGQPLTQVFAAEGEFWRSVLQRAEKLYQEGRRKKLVKGLYTP